MHNYLQVTRVSNGPKRMIVDVHQIKSEHSEKEIITSKRKLAQFRGLVHTACM